jgi:hypothetical protein
MIIPKQKRRTVIVKAPGPANSERATNDAVAFKRAADSYVRKATVSEKSANFAMRALGIQDDKGKLTKTYR